MTHHLLKITDNYFNAKLEGIKPFEIRYNDRGFQKGDTITYTCDKAPHFERPGLYEITYVIGYNQKQDWVVFADRIIEQKENPPTNNLARE